MTPVDIANALQALARRARNLPPPLAGRPHAFHEAKSELQQDLENLALEVVGRGPKKKDEPDRYEQMARSVSARSPAAKIFAK